MILNDKQLNTAFELIAQHQEESKATLEVYEYLKSLRLKEDDQGLRIRAVQLVVALTDSYWETQKIADWIKPIGPFSDVEEFFMCMSGTHINFNEFKETFLNEEEIE